MFWGTNDVFVTHYQPRGVTLTQLLRDVRKPAIRTKRRGLHKKEVLLLHGNARPHTARQTKETTSVLEFELLPHPPYNPDLTSSDFHLFGSLREAVRGRKFR